MALMMVHLMAADLWAKAIGRYGDSPEFFLGALSPDAMHVRCHDDKSQKNAFHLNNWTSPHPEDVWAYWDAHSAPFDVGYGIHCLTDSRWVPRYREMLPGLLTDGRLDVPLYYREVTWADFALLDRAPRLREILGMLAAAEAPDDHPLLTRHELSAWRDHVLDFYRKDARGDEPARYMTDEYIDEFLSDCLGWLRETAGRFET